MKKKWTKIILIIVLVLAVIISGGYTYLYDNGLSGQYVNTKPKEGQIRVACVGDSITYGHGVAGWEKNNYPAILQELLGEEYHVANFGSSGACVNPEGDQPYTERAIYQESLEYDADILVFMLGTNDSKAENWNDIDGFMEDYMELLGSYLEGEDAPKVYIGLCAEAFFVEESANGVAKFDIQPAIVDEIVKRLERLSASSIIPFSTINIHALTEAHPEWFETDGIHPNKNGAAAIAEKVAEAIKGIE